MAAGAGVKVGGVVLPANAAAGMPAGTKVELFLRPEHVVLHAPGTTNEGLRAQVRELTFFGSLTRIKLALADTPDGEIWADIPSEGAERFAPGASVLASWLPESPRVMRL
jgi:hypothetical protein